MIRSAPIDVLGFSITELLLATALALLLITATISVTMQGTRLSQQLRLRNEVFEAGRYVINRMDDAISHAGFYGQLDLADTTSTVKADLCTGITTNAIRNTLNFPLDGLDNVAVNHNICNAERVLAESDILLIRHADRVPLDVSQPLTAAQHYIQALGDRYIVDTGANAAAFSLRQKDNKTMAKIRAWQQVIYYVSENNVFKRRRLIRGVYSASEPLAEGVDDFQIMYGIARLNNTSDITQGQIVDFVSLPASVDDWKNIVAIKYYLLMSSSENSRVLLTNKSYSYGDKSAVTFNDNKKRRLFFGYTRLRNTVTARRNNG